MKKIFLVATAMLLCLSGIAQEKRWAVVEFSSCYLRQKPDYESPLETQELMGTIVEILDEDGYWRKVKTPQPYNAWCTDKGLIEMNEAELKKYKEAPKLMFTELYGQVYQQPSAFSPTICDLVGGDVLRLVYQRGRWTEVMLPSGRKGYVESRYVQTHNGFTSIAQNEGSADSVGPELMESIIAEAEKLLGVPYLWGGMSAKGVDCSGLVRISYLMNGILLPRNASQQINCGDRVDIDYDEKYWEEENRRDIQGFKSEMKRRVQSLQRGDLVFFGTPGNWLDKNPRITHVGIYLGNDRIIHSSHCVRVNSLIPTDEDYYENSHRLIGAVRL